MWVYGRITIFHYRAGRCIVDRKTKNMVFIDGGNDRIPDPAVDVPSMDAGGKYGCAGGTGKIFSSSFAIVAALFTKWYN